jgi:structural hemagglutinin/hemolysin toxin protein RtxA
MIQIIVFVPVEHKEKVKAAMFEAGAGKMGNYDHCSFEYQGVGQFRPLEGSNPFIGKTHQLETVVEVKVEMICEDQYFEPVIKAMLKAHPYQTPAYYGIPVKTL